MNGLIQGFNFRYLGRKGDLNAYWPGKIGIISSPDDKMKLLFRCLYFIFSFTAQT